MPPEYLSNLAEALVTREEATELENLVSVLGDQAAQVAVDSHSLPELVESEQS